MPTRKIAELPKYCIHPEHNLPQHMSLEPGVWEHICPACGHRIVFVVEGSGRLKVSEGEYW